MALKVVVDNSVDVPCATGLFAAGILMYRKAGVGGRNGCTISVSEIAKAWESTDDFHQIFFQMCAGVAMFSLAIYTSETMRRRQRRKMINLCYDWIQPCPSDSYIAFVSILTESSKIDKHLCQTS